MAGRLEGKVAVITGAASGIGRATALALAEVGRPVSVWDLDGDAAQAVADECRALSSQMGRRDVVQCSISGLSVERRRIEGEEGEVRGRAVDLSLQPLGVITPDEHILGPRDES
jgi:NAD(P)-dependent dehydrogenase (short-subunit alcohol dehydrogenase family)